MTPNPIETRNSKLLKEFIEYCETHPEERFWQAIRNWSGADKILYEKGDSVDTFYWNDKTS